MLQKGDFHLHTNASDGKSTPKELVFLAHKKDIDIIAVTDHDTTMGTEEAVAAGLLTGVKVIPGIELSTTHNGESIHILGYFRDETYKNKEFQSLLQDMIDFRVERAKKIVQNLETYFTIKVDYNKILKHAHGVVARPHIAKAIIEEGYPYSFDEIFNSFLGNSSPAYVPNKKLSVEDGIKLLKKANAFVVLAHPVLVKKSPIDELLKYDFDGIEAIYPLNTSKDTSYLKLKALEYNKVITAGSDFHGIDDTDTKHQDMGAVSLKGEDLKTFLTNFSIN